jgi:hypothetical protein
MAERSRWKRVASPFFGLTLALIAGLLEIELAQGQQIHRNGFETLKMGWLKGAFDAPYQEKGHTISDQVAHTGRHSEYIQFEAKPGTFIHYAYALNGRAMISDELSIGLWLRANRPGMMLMARVVLPRERDPQNLDHLLTTMIRGDAYAQVGQWQHLEIGRPAVLTKQQQQLMQKAVGGKAIDFTDAYVDGLILNVYGGPGPTEVWIDDVEVGPITTVTPIRPAVTVAGPNAVKPAFPNVLPRPDSKGLVSFDGTSLIVGKRPFLFRGIVRTDTPLDKLREARFNTVFLPESSSPDLVREAGERGLFVVPMLQSSRADGKPMPEDELAQRLTRFNDGDVLFLDWVGPLRYEQFTTVEREVQDIHRLDPGRVPGGDVWDGLSGYARTLRLIGVHRWPIMTSLELPAYYEWLRRRRNLATQGNPGVFLWTTVQTHLPEEIAQTLYERSADGAFTEPIGPQAEHVQLLTYTALAAGVRGLAYSSDRFLADSHFGRDRLLACALTNLELEMLEPLIAGAEDAPEWVDTSSPDVKAAVIRSPLGILVLPMWQGPFAQLVPGQAALSKLQIFAPPMPHSLQGWEISPADVRHVKAERGVGTTKITLTQFGLTAAIVFTSNNDLVARFQEQAKGRRQLAAQWAHDMAAYELDKVLKVHDQLVQLNHSVPDAPGLVSDAQRRLKESRQLWEKRAFADAYQKAQEALRPLRILMRAEWEKAVRGTDSPLTTPYTASYFTLPRHWQMVDQLASATWGKNVLPGGDFEKMPQRPEEAWHLEDPPPLDDVELIAQRVGEVLEPELKKDTDKDKDKDNVKVQPGKDGSNPNMLINKTNTTRSDDKPAPTIKAPPHEGKLCAMLKIVPRQKGVAPRALERTVLALNSPVVRLEPGRIVRISGWICMPNGVTASDDGALLYDTAGGDAFALRLNKATPWKQFTVYRRVPASGTIQVTLALTGLGTVFFDDMRIEPLLSAGAATASK